MSNSDSLFFLLGNIGADVVRMVAAQKKNDGDAAQRSLERALLRLDDLIAKQQRSSRELLRLREILCDKGLSIGVYGVTDDELVDYFLPFAVASRS